MKKVIPILLLFFLLSGIVLAQTIKKPVVSGTFYPDSPKILAGEIKQFLKLAKVVKKDRPIIALISPHAGYKYSGHVAAYGYKAIKGAAIDTVIIIGSSHYEHFEGISVYPKGAWQTPLGNVSIDEEMANSLIESSEQISFKSSAFSQEHSLEVQVPFLQMVLDDFRITPILMGKFSWENCQILSNALLEATADRDGVLVIASTDMSHYHGYSKAVEIDTATIAELKKFDPKSLYYDLLTKEGELCGGSAVISTLLYAKAKGADEIEILKYANSGDVTVDKTKVVGYLSALIYACPVRNEISNGANLRRDEKMQSENSVKLNEKQKKRLLEIARKTIDEYATSGKKLEFQEKDTILLKHMGAFVTIHKNGKLRGCIGNIIGRQPLYLTVRDMAIQSSSHDLRFIPVSAAELEDIDIEISVLTEPERVSDPQEIKMGVHGVIVKKGFSSGVFLPQVATETGWERDEFLSNLCAHKAGLSPSAWKDESTELYSFTAEVFGEKD